MNHFLAVLAEIITPAVPTVGAHGSTTVTVTAPATTDDVGVTGYNFYFNGVKNNSTPVPGAGPVTYKAIQLHPSTTYSITVTALDNAGNESAQSPAVSVTTNAVLAVAFDAVGTPVSGATVSGSTTSGQITHVMGTGDDGLLEVVLTPGSGGTWNSLSTYTNVTVVSNIDGPLTLKQSNGVGPGGQQTGAEFLFEKVRPSPGTHTLTWTINGPGSVSGVNPASVSYLNVGSTSALATYGGGSGSFSTTVQSQTGGLAFIVGCWDAAPTGFNGTSRVSVANSTGHATALLIGDKAGGSAVTTLSVTSTGYQGGGIVQSLNEAT